MRTPGQRADRTDGSEAAEAATGGGGGSDRAGAWEVDDALLGAMGLSPGTGGAGTSQAASVAGGAGGGKLKAAAARPALEKALHDSDHSVVAAASAALKHLA